MQKRVVDSRARDLDQPRLRTIEERIADQIGRKDSDQFKPVRLSKVRRSG
jgi:hypothetical protein